MDRKSYLAQLETALRERYPEPQVRDILTDYGDFFDSGAAEGKNEAELCAEFGPPERAARELKSESAAEPARQGVRLLKTVFAAVLSVLAAFAALAVLCPFFGLVLHISSSWSVPDGPVDFPLALLLPLVLEALVSLWFSLGSTPKHTLNWVPRVLAVFAVPVAAILLLLVVFSLNLSQVGGAYDAEGPFGPVHFLIFFISYGTAADIFLLTAAAVFLMLRAVRGHEKARWLLFLDTTLTTVFLNFASILSHIRANTGRFSAQETALCFLWAVLPNLAAMGIFWAARKLVSIRTVRRAKAWTGR